MDISNYNIEQCDAVSVLNAIIDMHDHPQKIDQIAAAISPIAAAAAAYSEGKPQLAQAITAKGVTTAADASLATMAANILSIQQETITIDGGEMYAKQLYGVKDNSIVPGYWNLYEVMAYLLSKTSSEQYSILLCEIPKGDAEYTFGTAVTPGSTPMGYVFSDDWQLNGEGSLYIHDATEASHAWNDDLDMKGNRWVVWLFAQVMEDATAPTVSLGAAATDCPQPRSIHIGRHMGAITATANGVLSEIVVTDGNVLDDFNTSTYTMNMGKCVVFRNLKSKRTGNLFQSFTNDVTERMYVQGDTIGAIIYNYSSSMKLTSMIIEARVLTAGIIQAYDNQTVPLAELDIIGVKDGTSWLIPYTRGVKLPKLKSINFIKCEKFTLSAYANNAYVGSNIKVYIGYDTNETDKEIAFGGPSSSQVSTSINIWQNITYLELQNGWKKPLDIKCCISLTKENVQTYIFDRLGVNTSGTTVTIHLATAVYDLFTAEEIAAVTTRTSITIARG